METRTESLCLLRLDALELGDIVLDGRQAVRAEFVSFHIRELLAHRLMEPTFLGMADLVEEIRAP